jgi:hypothetical protein
VYDCIIYILYYIQHNGDVSLEEKKLERWSLFTALIFFLCIVDFQQNVVLWSNRVTVTVTYAMLTMNGSQSPVQCELHVCLHFEVHNFKRFWRKTATIRVTHCIILPMIHSFVFLCCPYICHIYIQDVSKRGTSQAIT